MRTTVSSAVQQPNLLSWWAQKNSYGGVEASGTSWEHWRSQLVVTRAFRCCGAAALLTVSSSWRITATDGRLSRVHAVELVFAIGWAAFWIYWLVAAVSMKRGRPAWSRELRIRAVILVLAILLVRSGAFRDHGLDSDPWRAGLGLILFAVGLGFAIWARVHIGRNWGTPMSQKDEPELVTSGPYRLVRHPIYSGILLAGSAPRWR